MNEKFLYEFLKEGFYGKKCNVWFILDFVFLGLSFGLIYFIVIFPYRFIKQLIFRGK